MAHEYLAWEKEGRVREGAGKDEEEKLGNEREREQGGGQREGQRE